MKNKIKKIWEKLYGVFHLIIRQDSPSRYTLEKGFFPILQNKKILYIGVKKYTTNYIMKLEKYNDLYTLDKDKFVAPYGSKKHFVTDVKFAHKIFPKDFFDVIILFGIIGFGLNKPKDVVEGIKSLKQILKPKGLFLIR